MLTLLPLASANLTNFVCAAPPWACDFHVWTVDMYFTICMQRKQFETIANVCTSNVIFFFFNFYRCSLRICCLSSRHLWLMWRAISLQLKVVVVVVFTSHVKSHKMRYRHNDKIDLL